MDNAEVHNSMNANLNTVERNAIKKWIKRKIKELKKWIDGKLKDLFDEIPDIGQEGLKCLGSCVSGADCDKCSEVGCSSCGVMYGKCKKLCGKIPKLARKALRGPCLSSCGKAHEKCREPFNC